MKFNLIFLLFLLCSCVQSNEQSVINEVEKTTGVVDIIKLYKQHYACDDAKRCEYLEKSDGEYRNCSAYSRRCKYLLKYLAEPGVNLECINEDNQSDECVLYRRNIHKSRVRYFDYKRFLGTNSIIKTDEDFLRLVEYYNNINYTCDSVEERTTVEKQECKNNKLKLLERMGYERVACMELFPNEYQTVLERTQGYYESQMRSHEHEFSSCKAKNRCIFLPSGENITAPELKSKCKGMCELQVPTAEQILESVKESMHNFAQYRKCSTDGWESEVLKYICPCDICTDTPICAPNAPVPAQK